MSTTTACSSRSFSLASRPAASLASSAASSPRGADPAMATVSNDRPWVRTSRSGVAPRKVVPFRRERERRALGRRPRQVAKRRDDVEIGGRAEDEPARQHDLVDPATPDRTGEQADRPLPIRTIGPFLDRPERAGRASRRRRGRRSRPTSRWAGPRPPWSTASQAACTSPGSGSSDRSAASATVSVADDPCLVTPNVGSTSDEAPNDAHGSPASGFVPLNPRPPSRTGPPSRVTVVRCAVHANGIGQHLAPGVRRLDEAGRPCGLDGPGASDADDRPVGGRLEPERRLEVERAGGREQVDRIERGDGQRGRAEAPRTRPAATQPAARSRPSRSATSVDAARRSTTVTASWPSGRRSALRGRPRSGAGAPAASGRPIRAARDRRPAASARRPR